MPDRRFAVALLLCLLAWPARAETREVPLPDTPAGRGLGAFLKALNSGDPETIKKYHADDPPGPGGDHAAKDVELFGETGGLVVVAVVRATDTEIAVDARAKKDGAPFEVEARVMPDPPYKIVGLRLRPGGGGPRPSARRVPPGELPKAIAAIFDERAARDEFSGAVLVAKDGAPVFEKAYGLADAEHKTPNRVDTKFNLGSMNKMFTAVAVVQLAEAGKLSFDDRVGKLLPDYPNRDVAEKVTVRDLLTHTSGLGSFWNAKFDERRTSVRSVADYLALFADDPLLFEPGSRFEYSNAGYVVLGAIVEKVTGERYDDYVREHVYAPAGMKDTAAYAIDERVPNLAVGYTTEGGTARHENTAFLPGRGGPAGGGYSTVEDLTRFARALVGHKLLDAMTTDLATAGKGADPADSYGYGFGNRTVGGKRYFGHNGGAPGIGSELMIFPDSGYTVAVMTNRDPRDLAPVMRAVAETIAAQ